MLSAQQESSIRKTCDQMLKSGEVAESKLDVWQERPCGLMDKASVSDTGDCKFESCQGRKYLLPPIESQVEIGVSLIETDTLKM